MGSVCVVGSANLDLVARVARLPAPGETVLATAFETHAGGKGRNQAVAAARAGADVAFVGCVGDDAEGGQLRASLAAESIDVRGLAAVASPTGRAFIAVGDDGENAIVVVAGANATVSAQSVAASVGEPGASGALLHPGGAVLAQLEIDDDAVAAAFRAARSAGTATILNAAPARALTALLGLTDVLIVNEHEASVLSGQSVTSAATAESAARSLLDAGPATVVVTLGAAGALAVSAGTGALHHPSYPVDVVDTTGAGDAWCGAFAAALAAGRELDAALASACAAGALAVSQMGASPPALTRAAMERLVSGAG